MTKRTVKDYILITFGAVLAAASIYFFMMPSQVVVGSVSALAMVLSNFVPIPVSMISLAINAVLLILGFFLIGPEFGAKTVYTSLLIPLSLGAFELIFPDFVSFTGDPLLDMICHLLVVGAAMALLFSCNASSGGLDIVAKIMSKYMRIGLGTAVTASGMAVALSSVFCYDTKIVVLSVLGTYFSGIIVDRFIFGLNLKRRVCVISQKTEEIVDYLLHELHSGATLYESIGAFDNTVHMEIVTIVDKHEYRLLMERLRRIDPKAFVTVISVGETRYVPKTWVEKKK
ncbi:MAG: YitT family protein [Clostridia bacterium]|nr:YitT family protein [Clostridia bacterium]